jgi:hypothetical protein
MSAFLDGALRPRLGVTLGAIAFALVEIFALCLVVSPDVVARLEPGVLARNTDDDGAALTHALVTAQRAPARSSHVALVGASSMREAIWHIDSLADTVAQDAGLAQGASTLSAFDLTSGGQALAESLAVLRALPESQRGVVVLGIGPGTLFADRDELQARFEHPISALAVDDMNALARALGMPERVSTGIYFLDHLQFFVSRPQVPVRLAVGALTLRRHRYLGRTPWTEARWAERLDALRLDFARRAQDEALVAAHLAALEETLTRLARDTRWRVVLIEPPLAPRARPTLAEARQAAHALIAPLAERMDVPLVDLDAEARLVDADFHDFTHLRSEDAMRRYEARLAALIAQTLDAARPAGGQP